MPAPVPAVLHFQSKVGVVDVSTECSLTPSPLSLPSHAHALLQAGLSELKDVLFVGNPMYEGLDRREAKLQVLKRLPQVCLAAPPPLSLSLLSLLSRSPPARCDSTTFCMDTWCTLCSAIIHTHPHPAPSPAAMLPRAFPFPPCSSPRGDLVHAWEVFVAWRQQPAAACSSLVQPGLCAASLFVVPWVP